MGDVDKKIITHHYLPVVLVVKKCLLCVAFSQIKKNAS
jgi:hypothetical protein